MWWAFCPSTCFRFHPQKLLLTQLFAGVMDGKHIYLLWEVNSFSVNLCVISFSFVWIYTEPLDHHIHYYSPRSLVYRKIPDEFRTVLMWVNWEHVSREAEFYYLSETNVPICVAQFYFCYSWRKDYAEPWKILSYPRPLEKCLNIQQGLAKLFKHMNANSALCCVSCNSTMSSNFKVRRA